ncbi:hypothetical protein [Lysinibacillus fusiformis]
MIKRTLQYLLALFLAFIIFVILVAMSPYSALKAARELVTGEGDES